MLDCRLLGPLDVRIDGEQVDVPPGNPRKVLAVLALSGHRPVNAERLAHALWEGRPPRSARNALQVHVSALRRALGPTGRAAVETTDAGYGLRRDASSVDVDRFDALVEEPKIEVM